MKQFFCSRWRSVRLASLFHENTTKNEGFLSSNALQFRYGSIVPKKQFDLTSDLIETYKKYTIIQPGDIMINGLNLNYDFVTQRVAIVPSSGIITSAYICLRPRDNVNLRFYTYYLKALDSIKVFNGLGTGIRLTLSYDSIKNMVLPIPPREEQDQIVRYLDWQVSKINRLIAAKRKQIALLKEHRTAKINQAVTTGIHSDTQLAYTGYNWLPYAPANWKPVPAKALFRNVTELRRQDDSMLAATQKYGLIEQSEYMRLEGRRIVLANDNLDKWLHTEPNDYIISLRSFQGGLEMCSKPGCVTWHYVVLRAQQDIYPDFYKWFFKSAAYIGALQKTSDFIRDGQDLRFSNFVKVGLFNIPMDEQREIAAYLNREIPKYDVAIDNLEKQIGQITELRTRLISDVVTGQVDVRGIEVPEFEYVGEADVAGEQDEEETEEEVDG